MIGGFTTSNSGFKTMFDYGSGGFTVGQTIPSSDLHGIGLGDVDGDLSTVSDLGRLMVLTNMTNGMFGAMLSLGVGDESMGIAALDVNGDGRPDPICGNRTSQDISVLINQTVSAGLPPYPGTAEDLALGTGINGPPMSGLGEFLKTALPGDALSARMVSPQGTFDFLPPFLLGQLFFTGSPPADTPGIPVLHVDLLSPFLLFDGLNGPFGQQLLAPAGFTLGFTVPPGLAGISLLMQAAVPSPAAANGVFAASDGYEVQFQ